LRPVAKALGASSGMIYTLGIGRFARAVRINAAIDGAQARARMANGELRVVLPRITDRRGAGMLVPIESSTAPRE